jgi:hypothetical protein
MHYWYFFWRLGIKRPEAPTLQALPLPRATATATAATTISPTGVVSTPTLPRKVCGVYRAAYVIIHAIAVPERISYVVQNPRWRKCGTKFAVWDQDNLTVAYFDSERSHTIVEEIMKEKKWVAM